MTELRGEAADEPDVQLSRILDAAVSERDGGHWREALTLATRIQGQLRPSPDEARARWRLYLLLGDINALDLGEARIALAYYETARSLCETSRQVCLTLARLAQCLSPGPALAAIEEAGALLAEVGDEALRRWIEFKRHILTLPIAPVSESQSRRERSVRLAADVIPVDGLPPEYVRIARRVCQETLAALGSLYSPDVQAMMRELDELDTDEATRAARAHEMAHACLTAGALEAGLQLAERAVTTLRPLNHPLQFVAALEQLAKVQFDLGRYRESRVPLMEALGLTVSAEIRFQMLHRLSTTWIYDRAEEAVAWALAAYAAALEIIDDDNVDALYASSLSHFLGAAERVLREHGLGDRADALLAECERLLAGRGAVIDLGVADPDVRPVLEPRAASMDDDWQDRPMRETTTVQRTESEIVFLADPSQGFGHMDFARCVRPVSGDFAVEVVLPPAEQIIAETHLARTERRDIGPGGGGLIAMADVGNAMRIFAHVTGPGDVVVEAREDGQHRTLGRQLLPLDAPARLRLERGGDRLRAFVHVGDRWVLRGEMEIGVWNATIEAGAYGEGILCLYPRVVRRARSHLTGLAWAQSQATGPPRETDTSVDLPEASSPPGFPGIVARSPRMLQFLEEARTVAGDLEHTLIIGETGTGKELVARALHRLSPLADGPFVPVNCAAISQGVLERELFGHAKGAFTGADEHRGGLFQAAHRGTLFLDEIGDASSALQASLLRAVEEGAVRRVGNQGLEPVRVRIVAATNRSLESSAGDVGFRRDLYYRLREAELVVPPLRERPEDIPALARHVLERWSARGARPLPAISRQALHRLQAHAWPGNVRELASELERAARRAGDGLILPQHLGPLRTDCAPQPSATEPSSAGEPSGPPVAPQGARKLSRQDIVDAVRAAGGNVTEAARRLGISRNTAYRRLGPEWRRRPS